MLKLASLILCLATATAHCLAGELKESEIRKYAARSAQDRDLTIRKLRSWQKDFSKRQTRNHEASRDRSKGYYEVVDAEGRSGLGNPKTLKKTHAELGEKIAEYEEVIEKVSYPFANWYGELPEGRPSTGSIGKFRYKTARIIQVINDKSALAEVNFGNGVKQTVMLRGFGIAGITDDDSIEIEDIVYIAGTESYDTSLGSTNTVLTVKPAPLAELAPFADEFTLKSTARLWHFSDDREPVKGFFRQYKAGKVQILTIGKKEISVKGKELSKADQKYYRDLVKKKRKNETR